MHILFSLIQAYKGSCLLLPVEVRGRCVPSRKIASSFVVEYIAKKGEGGDTEESGSASCSCSSGLLALLTIWCQSCSVTAYVLQPCLQCGVTTHSGTCATWGGGEACFGPLSVVHGVVHTPSADVDPCSFL